MKKDIEIPTWGANYSPLRLVARKSDKWSVTVEEINSMSYDSTILFRTSLAIDIGIAPFSLIVLFDGTLVLPRCAEIPKSRALTLFNQHLTSLLLSGLFCGEILPDDVTPGSMNLWGYHRHLCPSGRYSKLSQALRTRRTDPDDAIMLVGAKPLAAGDYLQHYSRGSSISRNLPDSFATVFLPSCTGYCNEEWERALILGWSAAELLISRLWDDHVIGGEMVAGIANKRRTDFLGDTRTWTASTRIELLWQRKLIDDSLYALLDRGRSVRNSFVHAASGCSPEDARSVIKATILLVETISTAEGLSFNANDLMSQLDARTSMFCPPVVDENGRLLTQPQFWRYLDPAPGFSDWGDRPFEKIPEIELKPLQPKG